MKSRGSPGGTCVSRFPHPESLPFAASSMVKLIEGWLSGTYNYKLAKWLGKTLKPLSVNDHNVNDIFGFVEDLKNIQVDDHSILVSLPASHKRSHFAGDLS